MTEAEAIDAFIAATDAIEAGDTRRAVDLHEAVLAVHERLGKEHLISEEGSLGYKMVLTNIAVLYHRLGSWRPMLDATDRLIARYPRDGLCWQLRATAIKHIEGPRAGLRAVHRSLALDPGAANSHHEHACILVQLGRLEEAEDACKKALAKGARPEALLEDDELSRLRSRLGFRALF